MEQSIFTTDKGCCIRYINLNKDKFITLINHPEQNFLHYNKYSLYILRDGNYLDIKNLFSRIDRCQINLGRGGSQKEGASIV